MIVTRRFSHLALLLAGITSASPSDEEDPSAKRIKIDHSSCRSVSCSSESDLGSAEISSSLIDDFQKLSNWERNVTYKMELETGGLKISEDFENPTKISIESIKSMLIDYSTAERISGTESINMEPSMFIGMLLLADACELKAFALENLANNLLNHLLLNEQSAREILKYCVQDGSLKTRTKIATRLLLKFMERKKIMGSITGTTLEMGINSKVRTVCARILYNGHSSDNKPIEIALGSDLPEIETIKMRHDPLYGADELSEHERYLLLSLIGMLRNGRHVIAANCVSWVPEQSLARVLEIVNVENVGGFSAVKYKDYHAIGNYFEDNKEYTKNIEYLDFEFPEADHDDNLEKMQSYRLKFEEMLSFLGRFSLKRIRVICTGDLNTHFEQFLNSIGKNTVIEVLDYYFVSLPDYTKNCELLATRKIENFVLSFSPSKGVDGLIVCDATALLLGNVENLYLSESLSSSVISKFAQEIQDSKSECLKSLSIDISDCFGYFKARASNFMNIVFRSKILENLFLVVHEKNLDDLKLLIEAELTKATGNVMKEISFMICKGHFMIYNEREHDKSHCRTLRIR